MNVSYEKRGCLDALLNDIDGLVIHDTHSIIAVEFGSVIE